MAREGKGRWEITAVAPEFFFGDLRPVTLERYPGELCELEPVPVRFSNRIHVMLYGRRLRDLLCDGDWDVVHCWEEPYIFAGGQVARWTPDRAALVYATFQNIQKSYPWPFSSIERFAMKRAAGWIAFGHTVEQALSSRGGYADKPHRMIPPGVDIEAFKPDQNERERVRRELSWHEAGPPVIGFLGRFVSDKGLNLLMRVMDRLTNPWRALFIGSGPMEKELKQWAAGHGDKVRILTGIKHDDVPSYLNAMDVLCAPSQTMPNWREQLGRMLLEAFACGVPVIASDSGEIPFVVHDAGMIVGEKDEAGWVRALDELLGNPQHRAELATRGLQRAREIYAWPVVAREHLEFFDELVERCGR